MARTIAESLAHAVTEFDRKNEARASKRRGGYHNPNALALYLGRVADILADIERGAPVAEAVARGFDDRLLTAVERSMIADGHYAARAPKLATHGMYYPVTPAPESDNGKA